MTQAKKSFLEQHKDTLQVAYGTAMVVALYFGLSNKIELIVQQHNSDVTMLKYQIDELKSTKNSRAENVYSYDKYAVLPKETKINNE